MYFKWKGEKNKRTSVLVFFVHRVMVFKNLCIACVLVLLQYWWRCWSCLHSVALNFHNSYQCWRVQTATTEWGMMKREKVEEVIFLRFYKSIYSQWQQVITEETDSFSDEITGLIRKSNCTKSISSSLFARLQTREYSDKEFITILYQ